MINYNILNKYCKNINDTGSVEIQIILITFKINKSNIHLKKNYNDISCKRNLIILLNNRFKLINILKKKNINIYNNLLNDLNLKN